MHLLSALYTQQADSPVNFHRVAEQNDISRRFANEVVPYSLGKEVTLRVLLHLCNKNGI